MTERARKFGHGEDGGGNFASSCMVLCYSTSELAEGVSMVGTAKEEPYRACEDSGGGITSPLRVL